MTNPENIDIQPFCRIEQQRTLKKHLQEFFADLPFAQAILSLVEKPSTPRILDTIEDRTILKNLRAA